VVTLSGAFLGSHRDEVLQLLRHEARQERDEHPALEGKGLPWMMLPGTPGAHIMIPINPPAKQSSITDEAPDEIVVTTTDIHTPRRIGNALERAYHGKLETRYGEDEYTLHVTWER